MVRGGPQKAGWAAILAPRGALEKPACMVLTSLQEKDRVSGGQWLCGSVVVWQAGAEVVGTQPSLLGVEAWL